jgi:methylmalonyl-CoA mutase N-terminal domain/subunit
MKEKYGAKSPRSWVMRFHSQTAGVTLTAQQPMNNVVRVAYQALAAVLGGTQSLHTNSMDETLALPTEEAVQVALRTQQLLAYETGVPNIIDPLGGSYYIEALTDQLEREAEELFDEIDAIGGVVAGLESGWFQRKIAQSAARQQWEIEQHRRTIVGVNEFVTDEPELSIPTLKVGADAERAQRARMAKMRAERDQPACTQALDQLREAARGAENVFPFILECARRYCTLYEIRAAMEDVFGAYREPVFF